MGLSSLWAGCRSLSYSKTVFTDLRQPLHNGLFVVHPEVRSALSLGDPVVALETTILTHGMPYPQNVETALEVEGIIREQGAVPATIGMLEGVMHVGLSSSQLQRLASTTPVHKISRRDFGFCLSKKCSGGTTVAGTMMCAYRVGIPVFVTGGIGGVHRDGEDTLDVSADLTELGRTPIAVICAGIKSILDVGRTLEYLETQGVPVVTIGGTDMVPSFFTANSGYRTDHRVDTPAEASAIIDANMECGVESGIVFAIPIPATASCIGDQIELAIQHALKEAMTRGIRGKSITPFVLSRVNEITKGKSLQANIALIRNNAGVGGQVAVELSRQRKARKRREERSSLPAQEGGGGGVCGDWKKGGVVIVGASILDWTARILSPQVMREGTNRGSVVLSYGGVARNIAECMARLGDAPLFISAVGTDKTGELMRANLLDCGLSIAGVRESKTEHTASYFAVLDHNGEMSTAIGDMDATYQISVDWVGRFSAELASASYVCMDGNIPEETMKFILTHCSGNKVPVWFEPTCTLKSSKPLSMLPDLPGAIHTASPNLLELRNMYQFLTNMTTSTKPPAGMTLKEKLSECSVLLKPVVAQIPFLTISLGKDGVLCCNAHTPPPHPPSPSSPDKEEEKIHCLHYPAATQDKLPLSVLSVSGAGDSFMGGMLSGIHMGLSIDLSVKAGLNIAYMSLQSMSAISSELQPSLLQPENIRQWAPWDPTPLTL